MFTIQSDSNCYMFSINSGIIIIKSSKHFQVMSSIFRVVPNRRFSVPLLRFFHHEFTQPEKPASTEQEKPKINERVAAVAPGGVRQKYKMFRDEDAVEIFDVEEERNRYQQQDDLEEMPEEQFIGLNMQRGLHGVLDVEDLVEILRKENADDIFVCSVPKDIKYVDYMVVCSGRSYRHMLAMAEFVRRVYKKKRFRGEIMPKIEGEKSRDWMALDLGNIALHIFSPQAREEYDLESLWAIGSEYDRECNKPQDDYIELFERHSTLLTDMKPIKNSS